MDSAELRGNSVPLPVVEALLTGRGIGEYEGDAVPAAWAVGQVLVVGDRRTHGGNYYVCKRAHTAATGNVAAGAPDQVAQTGWDALVPDATDAMDASLIRATGINTINLPAGTEDDVASRVRVVNMNPSGKLSIVPRAGTSVDLAAGQFMDFIRFPDGWRQHA